MSLLSLLSDACSVACVLLARMVFVIIGTVVQVLVSLMIGMIPRKTALQTHAHTHACKCPKHRSCQNLTFCCGKIKFSNSTPHINTNCSTHAHTFMFCSVPFSSASPLFFSPLSRLVLSLFLSSLLSSLHVSGYWTISEMWDLGSVPGPEDDVFIESTGIQMCCSVCMCEYDVVCGV